MESLLLDVLLDPLLLLLELELELLLLFSSSPLVASSLGAVGGKFSGSIDSVFVGSIDSVFIRILRRLALFAIFRCPNFHLVFLAGLTACFFFLTSCRTPDFLYIERIFHELVVKVVRLSVRHTNCTSGKQRVSLAQCH